jgi:hypothetical protein
MAFGPSRTSTHSLNSGSRSPADAATGRVRHDRKMATSKTAIGRILARDASISRTVRSKFSSLIPVRN